MDISKGKEIWGLVSSLGLSPVWMLQGIYLRRRVVRLEPAASPSGIVAGQSSPLRVVVLGESTAAGVGVGEHVDGLAGRVATALGAMAGRHVEWLALGRNGARVASVRRRLLPELSGSNVDLVFLTVGVNDSLKLTSLREFRSEAAQLVREISATGARLVLSSVPPLGRFPLLPQPLRFVMGTRAALLDRELQRLAGDRVVHAPVDFQIADHMMAEDGFHPSRAGYSSWAEQLAATAVSAFPDLVVGPPRNASALD